MNVSFYNLSIMSKYIFVTGGDTGLIRNLYDALSTDKEGKDITSLEASIESHLMAFAAEKSRLNKGELIHIEHK